MERTLIDATFASLVHPHLGTIMRIAAALVGQADAEDAAQEAMIRAWKSWPELRDTMAFRSWLLRIVVNICRDWQKGRFGTHQRLNFPLSDSDAFAPPPALIDNDPGTSNHAAVLDLRQALASLDEPLRLVVVLRYYGGMDATEIGVALSVPAATIRTRLRRALSLLRKSLDLPLLASPALHHERSR